MLSRSKMLYCGEWRQRSAPRARAQTSERFAFTLAATRPADLERRAGIAAQQPLLMVTPKAEEAKIPSFRDGALAPDLRCAIAHRGISRFRVRCLPPHRPGQTITGAQ